MRRRLHAPPLVDYGRGMTFPGSWYSGEPYEPERPWLGDPDERESEESVLRRARAASEEALRRREAA